MRTLSCLLVIALLGATPALAVTYVIDPEGTGDFPTIQAAVDAAINGDVIELTDGTFAGDGNRDVDYLGKAIIIRSQSGQPEQSTIFCDGSETDPHRAFNFVSGEQATSVLSGVTVTGGWVDSPERGAGVRCDNSSSPRIESCIFTGNRGNAISCDGSQSLEISDCRFHQNESRLGGGIYCRSSTMFVDGCDFTENQAEQSGAGIYGFFATAEVSDCTFRQNSGNYGAAVGFNEFCQVSIADCLFVDNTSIACSAVALFLSCTGLIERCTFTGNVATSGSTLFSEKISNTTLRNCTFWNNSSPGGTILAGHQEVWLENCIIADDAVGAAVFSYYDYTELSCCDIHGNAGGDWVGHIADQYGVNGNICLDPLFCDPGNGDFTLDETSPCAPFSPPNTACDLIGAEGVGCGATAVEATTWGQLKAVFHR